MLDAPPCFYAGIVYTIGWNILFVILIIIVERMRKWKKQKKMNRLI